MGIFGVLKSDADMPDFGVKRRRICNSLLQWNHLEADQWVFRVLVVPRSPKLDLAKETVTRDLPLPALKLVVGRSSLQTPVDVVGDLRPLVLFWQLRFLDVLAC